MTVILVIIIVVVFIVVRRFRIGVAIGRTAVFSHGKDVGRWTRSTKILLWKERPRFHHARRLRHGRQGKRDDESPCVELHGQSVQDGT